MCYSREGQGQLNIVHRYQTINYVSLSLPLDETEMSSLQGYETLHIERAIGSKYRLVIGQVTKLLDNLRQFSSYKLMTKKCNLTFSAMQLMEVYMHAKLASRRITRQLH